MGQFSARVDSEMVVVIPLLAPVLRPLQKRQRQRQRQRSATTRKSNVSMKNGRKLGKRSSSSSSSPWPCLVASALLVMLQAIGWCVGSQLADFDGKFVVVRG